MDGEIPAQTAAPAEMWALVEIFGHRSHYGRISEVEQFGTKMMRVDVPGDTPDEFQTFFYGGASIFGIHPVTEAVAREGAERRRPQPVTPIARLASSYQGGTDDPVPMHDDEIEF
jgi:hypothetical protein